MVSLPSSWTKKCYLKKGDTIEIKEDEGNLLVSASAKKCKKETSIQLKQATESSARTALVNAYRTGYDVIRVSFQQEEQFGFLKNATQNYLLGFEILQKNWNSCVIESVSEPSEEQFEIIFKKIFYTIFSLIELTKERLEGKTVENYKEMVYKIHQYDNYCRRVLAKKNVASGKMALYWSFLTLMTHGQRELYHLHTYLDKNPVPFGKVELLDKLHRVFALLFDGYLKKDFTRLEKVHELEKEAIYHSLYTSFNGDKRRNIVLHHLASSLRNFYLASSPLMGLLSEDQ